MGMNVNEVYWPWACCSQDAEIIALGVQRIESAQRVRRWMISARDIRLCTESRLQRYCGNPVARLRRDGPSSDVCRSKVAELPNHFIVEIPAGAFVGDRPRYSRAK